MNKISEKYRQLIADKRQLNRLINEGSVSGFLNTLKSLWSCETLTDNQLIHLLNECNQIADLAKASDLSGIWFVSSYSKKKIHWCFPVGRAVQPFQDQYVSACQQHLVNQFFRPVTSIDLFSESVNETDHWQPSGFIFHLSRCGSTLVSGCLSEHTHVNCLSEPPAITEILLDGDLAEEKKRMVLKNVLYHQRLAFPDQERLVIKWNAWDLFHAELIFSIWPNVPRLILVRNPLEILASHAKSAGRHMAGDPSLEICDRCFSLTHIHRMMDASGQPFSTVYPVGVLKALLIKIKELSVFHRLRVFDYQDLDSKSIGTIFNFLSLETDELVDRAIAQRMLYHSKDLDKKFLQDTAEKLATFNLVEQEFIQRELQPLYSSVLSLRESYLFL